MKEEGRTDASGERENPGQPGGDPDPPADGVASSSGPTADGGPASRRDATAKPLVRAHEWILDHWPTSLRRRIALVAVLVAVVAVAISWIPVVIGAAVDLGVIGYLGLMVVCWVGAGGALVPIPGVRPLSWVMIVNQGAILFPPVVAVTAALAMALGQTSYFEATHANERRRSHDHRLHLATRTSEPGHPTGPDAEAPTGRTDGAPDPAGASTSSGLTVSNPNRWSRLVDRWRRLESRGQAAVSKRMAMHPARIIFALAVVPNPLTTFSTVAAATTGVPFRTFFLASLGGFLVLTSALVIAGQGILAAIGIAG